MQFLGVPFLIASSSQPSASTSHQPWNQNGRQISADSGIGNGDENTLYLP